MLWIADEPAEYTLELLGREDNYPSDTLVLYAGDYSCAAESETLYEALLSLPEKLRNVLFWDFWCEFTAGFVFLSLCAELVYVA